jgi:hypothetical protein
MPAKAGKGDTERRRRVTLTSERQLAFESISKSTRQTVGSRSRRQAPDPHPSAQI